MADMYLGNSSGGFDLVGTTNMKNMDFENVKITQADYNSLSEAEKNKGIYVITDADASGGGGSADLIAYNNANSGLDSTNVQGAIDELNSNMGGLEFSQDENGNWGYRIAGADSVTPFLNLTNRVPSLVSADWSSFIAEVGSKYLITVGGINTASSYNYAGAIQGATLVYNAGSIHGTINGGHYPIIQSFIVEATAETVKIPTGVYAGISWFKIS